MKIVFPMAGRGSRFAKEAHRNPDYAGPKPFIPVRGHPMIRWASGSLPFHHPGQPFVEDGMPVASSDLVFVILAEHERDHGITARLRTIYGNGIHVVTVPEVTRGAAETVLAAREYIDVDEPMIVSDSDHFFDGHALWDVLHTQPEADGVIPVFAVPDGNPKWSFSRLGPDGVHVDRVAEKEPISMWANIGAYAFRRGADFVAIASDAIAENELTGSGEFYVAPLYNRLIARGGRVRLAFPRYVYGLGTPVDLEHFLAEIDVAAPWREPAGVASIRSVS